MTYHSSLWRCLKIYSSTRPFGAAVLDGVDLDIEGGGSTGYAAFVTQLRNHFSGASKRCAIALTFALACSQDINYRI